MNARVLLVLVAVWGHAALSTIADEWRFEVAADAPPVVSCPVDDAKWVELMTTHDLVAVGKDGTETV